MISRKFQYAIHDEYGTPGWKPVNMAMGDPVSGMAVAHDTLEHFPGDPGDAEGELQALGAMLWIRGLGNYWPRYEPMNLHTPGEHIGADLTEIMRHVLYENFSLNRPTSLGNRLADEQIEEWIHESIHEYLCNLPDEFGDRLEDAGNKQVVRAIRENIRRGFRLAQRRYARKISSDDLCTLFREIEVRADKALEHADWGSQIQVTVDLAKMLVRVTNKEISND